MNNAISPDIIYGLYPSQIRKAYGIDLLRSTGAGKTIAIIDAYGNPTMAADLAIFDAQFNLPAASITIAQPDGTPGTNLNWAIETALDVEWAHAVAPSANILLVEAKSPLDTDLLSAVDYANSHGANVVSMSWGGPEFLGEDTFDTYFNHAGVTYVASSGDTINGTEIQWPSVSSYVTAVGGTTLSLDANGNYLSERAWSGTVGGTSAFIPRPSFQDGFQSASNRGVPDVAFDADPNSGVAIYCQTSSGWLVVGGTSLSAPCWAGLFVLGALNGVPSVYAKASTSQYAGNFHDITTGSAINPAATGYDLVTGLGSPIANNLVPCAATQVGVETLANGSGTIVGAQSVNPGSSLTVYSVTRDQYGNFVANSAADSWSLVSKTSGVVDGDLVPSGDRKSAVFSGHQAGTGIIHPAISGLAGTNSGMITSGAMSFTALSLPSNINNLLGGVSYVADFTANPGKSTSMVSAAISNPSINAVTASPDGNSIYAWDNTNKALYYSSNAGKSYASLGINVNTGAFIGLKISPTFATDGTVFLVTSSQVRIITGGLTNVLAITGDLATKLEGGIITSFDISPYYTNGVLAIYIGVSGGAGSYSNVLVFKIGGLTWDEVGNAATTGSNMGYLRMPEFIADPQVIAIKLSPNYIYDAEVMAVYTLSGNTYLASCIAGIGWNNTILPSGVISTGAAASAVIAAGTDYFANSSGTLLVGTGAGLTNNGLFIVNSRVASGGTFTPILGGNVTLGNVPVNAIAVQGPTASSTVVVSSPGVAYLNITSAVTASTVSWVSSASYRSPTGTSITSMCYAGNGNAKFFVSSTGAGGGLNLSTDNGNTFNQIGLINVGANFSGTAYRNLSMVSDTNWYVRIPNVGLFQSSDKGISWTGIFGTIWGSPQNNVTGISFSQNFATNNTFILYNGTNIALLTTNGGATYSPLASPVAVGGLVMIEGDAYYVYSNTTDAPGLYVTTRPYVNATFTPAVSHINSVARNEADATHMTYAAGTTDGKVYQSTDGGVSFTQLGSSFGGPTDKITISYAPDGNLYAAATGNTTGANNAPSAPGIFKWVSANSVWMNINMSHYISSYGVSNDGTMYATGDWAGSGATYGNGIYRSLNYNATSQDGSSASTWSQINSTTFPGGVTTTTAGIPASGYPGAAGAPGNSTSGSISTLTVISGAACNTLYITEKTSTVLNSQVPQAVYAFVDSFIVAPTVSSPVDGTRLTTKTSVTFNWNALYGPVGGAAVSNTNYEVQLTNSTDFSGATTEVHGTVIAGSVTAAIDNYIAGHTTATMGVNPGGGTNALKAGTQYHWRVKAISPIPTRWTVSSFTTASAAVADFDADSKTDISVYRPSNGLWVVLKSGSSQEAVQQWGIAGDTQVAGDYDGDGKADYAVYRPSNGLWVVLNSGTSQPTIQQWGTSGDTAVPGDYNGDGKTDFAVYRPSNGLWIVLNSGSGTTTIQQWGVAGDIPVPGDYNGDGKTDFAVYRPSNGLWIILNSGTGTPTIQQWGTSGDIPVPGDYNGDGKTDIAVYRPSNGLWIVLNSGTGIPTIQQWGANGDTAVPGDYNGDGKTDMAVYRPTNGLWIILPSGTSTPVIQQWGIPDDVPVP